MEPARQEELLRYPVDTDDEPPANPQNQVEFACCSLPDAAGDVFPEMWGSGS